MTEEELGEKGRAIFDRLRADVGAADESQAPTVEELQTDERDGHDAAAVVEGQDPVVPLEQELGRLSALRNQPDTDEPPVVIDAARHVLHVEHEPDPQPDEAEVEIAASLVDVGEVVSQAEQAPAQPEDQAPPPPPWPATSIPDVVELAPTPSSPVAGTAVSALPPFGSSGQDPDELATTARPVRPPPTALPRVMAIANQKGGVGKTTTAVNLGAALAEMNYRVLVIDLDPQGNATTGLGINPRNLETSIYDVLLRDTPLEDCIEPTSVRNLFVCPATIDLAGAEIELVPAFSRELKLRRAIEQVIDDFDFFLIDCPPSLGLITVNGLAAATEVLVPIQCEYYALEGLGQLLRNVSLVQTNLNPRLEMTTIILTMYDARTKLSDQVAAEVRTHFGTRVCRNIVPRTVRLSEAPSFGQPIIVFDPTSRGAIAYRELAKEVSGGAPQRVR